MNNDHCIFEFDNFISKEKCDEIIRRFDNSPNKRVCLIKSGGDVICDMKRKNGLEIQFNIENPEWSDICLLFSEKLANEVGPNIIQKFCKHFEKYGENLDTIREIWYGNEDVIHVPVTDLQISRTTPNSEFGWHHDSGNPIVVFTAILYLNTIQPENGGATEFLFGKKVQPEAGKLLLFPAVWSNPHRGAFVREAKYILTCGVSVARP